MSNLEQLIHDLCPNGVEYKTVGEIALDIYRGAGIKRTEVTEEGIPCVRYGEIYTSYGIWFDTCISHTVLENVPSPKYFEYGDILFAITGESVDDIAKSTAYIGHDRCLAGGDIVVLKHNQDPKYLSYALSTSDARKQKSAGKVKSKVVHSSVPSIQAIQIPIPPLEVQREIVRILDSFSETTNELSKNLEAERAARKKQYEFYRDHLLSFGDNVIWRKLGDFAIVTKLAGFEFTNYVTYSDNGKIIALRGVNIKNGKLDTTDVKYIDGSDFSKLERSKLHIGDMLFTYVGTVGQVALIDEEDKYYLAPNVALIRLQTDELLPKYMMYYFQTTTFWDTQLRKLLQASSMQNIPMEKIRKFSVPIPSIEIQKKTIEILDNFDTICGDLNIVLPAEIEARKRQYEYYRDLLLSFADSSQSVNVERERERAGARRADEIKLLQYVFGFAPVLLSEVVAHKSSGATPNKANSEYYDGGTIPWIRTQDVRFNEITAVDSYITEKAVAETAAKWIPMNCVIVAISGASAGRCAINKIEAATNQHCLNLVIDENIACYRYVYYCVMSRYEELLSKKQGARGDLNSSLILSTVIPLPALAEQENIIDTLDRFDRLCNDLSEGLPAEIEARKKQYEFYRDKLLTF